MTKIIGRLNSVGIGKETVRGTAVAPGIWVPWTDVEYDDQVKTKEDEAAIGRLENTDGEIVTLKYGKVKIKSKIKDKSIGYLLLSLFGTNTPVAKSAPNATVYDHTFSVAQSVSHQSLTLSLKGPNDDVAMPNCVVDSLKIDSKAGDFVRFEANIMGKASASASQTVSFTAENDFCAKHLTFKKASAQSGLAAAAAISIRSFNMEIKTNAMLEEVLGSNTPNDILNQSFEIKGSVTLVHSDSTYPVLMLAGTYQALRFDFQNTDVTIGTSSNPGLQIDLHRASIQNYSRKMGLNDLIEESFDFTAHYSLTDSKMITAVLTNLQTAY